MRSFARIIVACAVWAAGVVASSVALANGVRVELAAVADCGHCGDCVNCAECADKACAVDSRKEAANAETFRKYHERILTQGELGLIGDIFSTDYVEHQLPPGLPKTLQGVDAVNAIVSMLRAAFPDIKATLEAVYVRGDDVIGRYRSVGTHTGDAPGFPASGKKFDVTGMDWVRMKDGKAVEHWGFTDEATMLRQLGFIPEMPGSGAEAAPAKRESKKDIGEAMSAAAAEALVRRFYDEALTKRNINIFDELVAPDMIDHSPSTSANSIEEAKATMAAFLGAFSDIKAMIDGIVVVGDTVISRYTMSGTNDGELMGMPATNRPVSVSGIAIERVGGGKFHERWENWDEVGFMTQLGRIPNMEYAPDAHDGE